MLQQKQGQFQETPNGTNVMITRTEFEGGVLILQRQVSCYTKIDI